MEQFGAIGVDVEEGIDKAGDDFVFLFSVEDYAAREQASLVQKSVKALTET